MCDKNLKAIMSIEKEYIELREQKFLFITKIL